MIPVLSRSRGYRRPVAAGGGGGGGAAALTSGAGSSLRNNFGNFVGFAFTVGASNLYVKSIGRWKVAGNSATHQVKLVDGVQGTAGTDIPGGSVNVDLSTGSAGGYVYVALAGTIVLSAGGHYIIASAEVSSGDEWYNTFAVTSSADLTVDYSSFFGGAVWGQVGTGESYVPPNFLYDLTP